MARVDHKKIKQLISQKQKTITDRQFFSSRILGAHFADMALAQTRRYGYRRRVKVRTVWKPKEQSVAQTNNEHIWINAGHRSVTRHKTRPERYEQVCGLFAHELGHVLYTDFLNGQTYHSRQDACQWYPEQPLLRNSTERYAEAELMDYIRSDPKHKLALSVLSHEILNVLEDGYIEQRVLSEYPGVLGTSLAAMRASHFEEMPTLSQCIEEEAEGRHIWQTILQLILSYMKWGELKYGDTPVTDERVQVVFSLLGGLDRALLSRDARDRCRTANLILIRCWSYIKDFLDQCEEMAEQTAAAGGGSGGGLLPELVKALMSAMAGGSEEGEGETVPVAGNGSAPSSGKSPTAKERAATAKLADEAGETSEDPAEKEAAAPDPGPGKEGEDEDQETLSAQLDGEQEGDGEPPAGDGAAPPGASQQVSDQELGRIPFTETDELSVPEGGGIQQAEDYHGTGYTGAASDIERLLEKIAENTVCTKLERQRTKELTELAQSISYGDIHNGVNMTVHRIADVDDELKEEYREISGDLLHISRQLQKSVSQQLQDSRRGGKQTGLLMGRRLDTHALCRNDGRVFCKNALPNETPALSVGLLLDESGSMCSCDRATYARATAIILYDFCQALGIPILVYGHSTGGGVDLYSYAEFDAIDRDDRYRMMDISARGSNRDGAALRYVAERLTRRPEDVKLLILVSDGQPADSGYWGTAAEEDLRGIKQEYQRKGILFVAAAIGSDKENIERIYGDSFLDITDLTKLPVKLAGVIKRFIRL